MTIDIAKAFTFMFEDPEWLRKLGIGTLITLIGLVLSVALIGIIPLIVIMGYTLEVTRNVMDGQQYPLPEWDNWGRFLSRGLKLVVVFIVWLLPLIIPTGMGVIGGLLGNSGNSGGWLAGLCVTCAICLSFLWGLVVLVFSPAIYDELARNDQIAPCFNFTALWAFTRANLTNVIVAVLMAIVVGIVAAIIASAGIIALGIGLLVTVPFATLWQYLVQAHLFGQIDALRNATPGVTSI